MGIESILKESEIRYGKWRLPRNKVSELDGRDMRELKNGFMRGGDRMNGHGYGKVYAKYLWPFQDKEFNLVEVGILAGSGLAAWADAFPMAHIYGLDIDLGHWNKNIEALKEMGAFWSRVPEVREFDQLKDQKDALKEMLGGGKIQVCIDDGLHTEEAVVKTIRSVKPFLGKEFLYFIEDVPDILESVQKEFPKSLCVRYKTGKAWNDELIVVRPR